MQIASHLHWQIVTIAFSEFRFFFFFPLWDYNWRKQIELKTLIAFNIHLEFHGFFFSKLASAICIESEWVGTKEKVGNVIAIELCQMSFKLHVSKHWLMLMPARYDNRDQHWLLIRCVDFDTVFQSLKLLTTCQWFCLFIIPKEFPSMCYIKPW